jgi:hypothetical protein
MESGESLQLTACRPLYTIYRLLFAFRVTCHMSYSPLSLCHCEVLRGNPFPCSNFITLKLYNLITYPKDAKSDPCESPFTVIYKRDSVHYAYLSRPVVTYRLKRHLDARSAQVTSYQVLKLNVNSHPHYNFQHYNFQLACYARDTALHSRTDLAVSPRSFDLYNRINPFGLRLGLREACAHDVTARTAILQLMGVTHYGCPRVAD